MPIITESAVNSLILTSREAEAIKFKKWLTFEVLPSVRKTGAYSIAVPVPGNCAGGGFPKPGQVARGLGPIAPPHLC